LFLSLRITCLKTFVFFLLFPSFKDLYYFLKIYPAFFKGGQKKYVIFPPIKTSFFFKIQCDYVHLLLDFVTVIFNWSAKVRIHIYKTNLISFYFFKLFTSIKKMKA